MYEVGRDGLPQHVDHEPSAGPAPLLGPPLGKSWQDTEGAFEFPKLDPVAGPSTTPRTPEGTRRVLTAFRQSCGPARPDDVA